MAVTHRADTAESLRATDIAHLVVPESDVYYLVENWGLTRGEDLLVERVVAEYAGESTPAIDRFPPLRLELDDHHMGLVIQPCRRIELQTDTPEGQRSRVMDARLDWDTVTLLTTADSDEQMLAHIARELRLQIRPAIIVRQMREQEQRQRQSQIRKEGDLLRKIALAIGTDALRDSIPLAALEALTATLGRDLEDREIAQLALASDGYSILSIHSSVLQARGLNPPSQWAGRQAARSWVRQHGFPAEFAGFVSSPRQAETDVDGPPVVGPLHDYQSAIAAQVRSLVSAPATSNRGIVSLPTGAGKTRVAVEALVDELASTDQGRRVIWVAETDELCEQAAQTWSLIWRNSGRRGTPLTVSRLWGSNEVIERDGYQVVVVGISKLLSLTSRPDFEEKYGWLADPMIIVVDEAHRSITTQYTRALSPLGRAKRVADVKVPLLGLTATPFRGFSDSQTKQLATRYQGRLLDEGVFPNDDVYAYLQGLGVLAQVEQRELPGAEIVMTEDEIEQTRKLGSLADSVTTKLSRDRVRNNTIVESILGLPGAPKILLFATSVENARVLASLLTFRGVEARAVSCLLYTSPSPRD